MDITERKITKIAREASKLIASVTKDEPVGPSEIDFIHAVRHNPGASQNDIAKKLFISPSTVRTHVKHVYAKLDVNSREELIARVEAGVRE